MTNETLTLRASGPAEARLSDKIGDVEIATMTEVELDAELEIDAEWLTENGCVNERGAWLRPREVAELICETRSGDDGQFEALEGWTLEVFGTFNAYASVAYRIADEVVSIGTDDKTARVMCHVLHVLADYAVDERPLLVTLDILDSYDPKHYSRGKVISELSAAAETMPEATPSTEVAADD